MNALFYLGSDDLLNDWKSSIGNVLMRSAFDEHHRVPFIFTNDLTERMTEKRWFTLAALHRRNLYVVVPI